MELGMNQQKDSKDIKYKHRSFTAAWAKLQQAWRVSCSNFCSFICGYERNWSTL